MQYKVIEMDQRTSEQVAVAEFRGEDAEAQAEARVRELEEKARKEKKDYLRYWVSD